MKRQFITSCQALLGSAILVLFGCAPPSGPCVRVLMVVGGSYHDYETLPPKLAERLTQRGEMQVEVTKDLAALNAQNLTNYQYCSLTRVNKRPWTNPSPGHSKLRQRWQRAGGHALLIVEFSGLAGMVATRGGICPRP